MGGGGGVVFVCNQHRNCQKDVQLWKNVAANTYLFSILNGYVNFHEHLIS